MLDEKLVIVLSLGLLFKDIELCAKFHDKAFFPLVEDLMKMYSQNIKESDNPRNKKLIKDLLVYQFFTLRYLYSLPKNRMDFKLVFPPK